MFCINKKMKIRTWSKRQNNKKFVLNWQKFGQTKRDVHPHKVDMLVEKVSKLYSQLKALQEEARRRFWE